MGLLEDGDHAHHRAPLGGCRNLLLNLEPGCNKHLGSREGSGGLLGGYHIGDCCSDDGGSGGVLLDVASPLSGRAKRLDDEGLCLHHAALPQQEDDVVEHIGAIGGDGFQVILGEGGVVALPSCKLARVGFPRGAELRLGLGVLCIGRNWDAGREEASDGASLAQREASRAEFLAKLGLDGGVGLAPRQVLLARVGLGAATRVEFALVNGVAARAGGELQVAVGQELEVVRVGADGHALLRLTPNVGGRDEGKRLLLVLRRRHGMQ